MSDNLEIRTNNVPRQVLYWFDLSEKERREFDYIDTDEAQADASFFRYKGAVYDIGNFMLVSGGMRAGGFRNWDGYASDSFFSGVLIKYCKGFEHVIAATYFS